MGRQTTSATPLAPPDGAPLPEAAGDDLGLAGAQTGEDQDVGADGGVIPTGVAHFPLTRPAETRDYVFLLLPRFTLLAFSSAVEPLRVANQLSQRLLYRWRLVSQDGQAVQSSSGISVNVHGALGRIGRKATVIVCSGVEAQDAAGREALDWLRDHAVHGGAYGGICTGAFTLARAGLLKGRRYTVHWENQPGFRELFQDYDPSPRIFEIDGPLMTCGGGAASTDMMLDLVARHHGDEFAMRVGDMCLHGTPRRSEAPQTSSLAVTIGTRNPKLIRVIRLMQRNLETPLSIEQLAEAAGYSVRQLERQFKSVLSVSPATYYRNLRVELARSLLFETEMSISEIAAATGFESANHFGKVFRGRFGASPRNARQFIGR